MASATAQYKAALPIPPPEITKVTLMLSAEEADFLYTIVGKMNGTKTSPLYQALSSVGCKPLLGYSSMPTIDVYQYEKGGR